MKAICTAHVAGGRGGGGGGERWPLVGFAAIAAAAALLSLAGAELQRVSVLLVLAPMFEEAVFRAGLQEVLLRRGFSPRMAILATAATFSLTHVVLRGDVAAFVVALPALLVGAVYGRWRRLRLCIAMHCAMNAAWLGWSLAGVTPSLGA